MDCDHALPGIDLADVPRDLSPAVLLRDRVLLWLLRKIIRHGCLARKTPGDGQRSPARDDVAPVLLHLGDAHLRKEITPASDDAGHQSAIHEIAYPEIGHVEVLRIDPAE